MKTFKTLTLDDKIFRCNEGVMEYDSFEITSMDQTYLIYNYGDKFERLDVSRLRKKGDYHNVFLFFSNETDAIRYCKAQMMKRLFALIDKAKKSINEVKEFRLKNYELLNHKWTERQIVELENQMR